MKLLIVEDEKRLCQTVAKHLKGEGYTIDAVSYTHLDVYKRQQQLYEVNLRLFLPLQREVTGTAPYIQ